MSRPLAWRIILAALLVTAQGGIVAAPSVAKTPGGTFVWHDLVTDDPERCRAFYGALFGWTFEAAEGVDPGYTIIKEQGRPIAGIVRRRQDGQAAGAQWLAYVAVGDVDRAAKSFEQAGGRIFRGPLNAKKDLRVAVVADAQGAPLGLASRGPNVADERVPGMHRWLWMEYVARDVPGALDFLGRSIGFGHEIHEVRDTFTYYLLTTDRPHAGLFRSPWTRDTSAWLPYIRVADPAAMATRVTELGGSIALAPRPEVRNGSLAIVLDPTGAAIALQKFPFERGGTQ